MENEAKEALHFLIKIFLPMEIVETNFRKILQILQFPCLVNQGSKAGVKTGHFNKF